ncbi:MAG: GHKL domain-containing protein [Bacillota bacterium]|nr:GHKL domain-containing protein [Bacillota bacterium]
MLSVLNFALLFIAGIIQMLLQGIIISSFFGEKLDKKRLAIFSILTGVANTILNMVIPQNLLILNIIIYLVILFTCCKTILYFSKINAVIAPFFIMILNILIQYFGLLIVRVAFAEKYNAAEWASSVSHAIAMRYIGNVVLLLPAITSIYFRLKIKFPKDINNEKLLGIAANIFITCFLIVPNILYFNNTAVKIPTEVMIFNIISIFILLLLSIYNTLQSSELVLKKQETEFQKLYIGAQEEMIDTLRGFKHDLGNMIQVMGGYLMLGDYAGLENFHKQMQKENQQINNISPLNAYVKDNPAVYGLLLAKMSHAVVNDIELYMDIQTKIDIGKMNSYEFCRILGILMDNALEAAENSDKKLVEFIIRLDQYNRLIVEVSNSYSGEIDKIKIFEKGFTTKGKHSGFGLWEVSKIISKYPRCNIDTSITEDAFTQKLVIW